MFRALDKVDYRNLQLNDCTKDLPDPPPDGPRSLLEQACVALNWSRDLDSAVRVLPVHLVPKLLEIAISNSQYCSISVIIANWPLEVLRLKDVVKGEGLEILETEPVDGYDIYCCLVEGLLEPTKHCKLKCFDCGDMLSCEHHFTDMPHWPLRSLSRVQLKHKNLLSMVKKAAVGRDVKIDAIHLPMVVELLSTKAIHAPFHFPRGRRLEIKLDNVDLSINDKWFNDFVISQLLRDVTPVFVTVKNLNIKAPSYSCAPNLQVLFRLRKHSPETLKGLSVQQLDYGVFYSIAKDIQNITSLEALDLNDCNIYLTEGVTRSCTKTRSHLTKTLSSFNHLRRLDLSFNYLLGCLGELLNALSRPLEYLNVEGSDLNEQDLKDLAQSKHSPHLLELNLSKVCQYPIYERDKIHAVTLLSLLKHFPKLQVLNLAKNHLPSYEVTEFCDILSNNLLELKGLDVSGNRLEVEALREIIKACAVNKKLQLFRITNMDPWLNNNENQDVVLENFRNLTNGIDLHHFRIELVETYVFPFFF